MQITDINWILLELFQRHCLVNKMDQNANFFDLGIQSLELIHIASNLSQLIGKEVSILWFYEYPNLSLLSKYIESVL